MLIKSVAPAKVNLGLKIKGKRDDGYHEIDTIMQSVDLCDVITVKDIPGEEIKMKCNRELDCEDRNNTACKAAIEFFNYTGIKSKGIEIEIVKKIPVCAGLAGGSSDAAAVIVSLDKMFNLGLSVKKLREIGERTGADVPFCILGGTVRAYGIGSDMERIKSLIDCGILIVKPSCTVLTKYAYEMYDKYGHGGNKDLIKMIDCINKESIIDIAENLFNDFELFIKNDEISTVKKEIIKNNPLGVCMSGSGPAVFGIFESFSQTEKCKERLKGKCAEVFSCRPLDHGVKILEIIK